MELQAQRAGGMPLGGYATPSCSCFIRMMLEHSEGCPSPGIGKTWKLQTFKAVSVHLLYMSDHVCMGGNVYVQWASSARTSDQFFTCDQLSQRGVLCAFAGWFLLLEHTNRWNHLGYWSAGPRLGLPRLHSDYCTGWANFYGSFQPIWTHFIARIQNNHFGVRGISTTMMRREKQIGNASLLCCHGRCIFWVIGYFLNFRRSVDWKKMCLALYVFLLGNETEHLFVTGTVLTAMWMQTLFGALK